MTNKMITENYCNDCNNVVHAVFNFKDFYDFKFGRIRCKCGCVIVPCNECIDKNGQHYNCSKCPWKNAEIKDEMTDDEYFKWVKENEPNLFEMFLNGNFGEESKQLAEKIRG